MSTSAPHWLPKKGDGKPLGSHLSAERTGARRWGGAGPSIRGRGYSDHVPCQLRHRVARPTRERRRDYTAPIRVTG